MNYFIGVIVEKMREAGIHGAGERAWGEAMPMYVDEEKWRRRAESFKAFVGNMGHNRNMSYYSRYPYLVRKCISMGHRVGIC